MSAYTVEIWTGEWTELSRVFPNKREAMAQARWSTNPPIHGPDPCAVRVVSQSTGKVVYEKDPWDKAFARIFRRHSKTAPGCACANCREHLGRMQQKAAAAEEAR